MLCSSIKAAYKMDLLLNPESVVMPSMEVVVVLPGAAERWLVTHTVYFDR
jgi:hypothetical protein